MLGKASSEAKSSVQYCFDRAALSYDSSCELQKKTADHLASLLANSDQAYTGVLDLGCGTGVSLESIARKIDIEWIYGLDLAGNMLNTAQHKDLPFVGSKSSLVQADFHSIPLRSRAVELVTSNMAFQWGENIPAIISECHRVLKLNGVLAFSMPNIESFGSLRRAIVETSAPNFLNEFPDNQTLRSFVDGDVWQLEYFEEKTYLQTFVSVSSLLRSFKSFGGNHRSDRHQAQLLKGHLERLDAYFSDSIPLQWSIAYVVVKKITEEM